MHYRTNAHFFPGCKKEEATSGDDIHHAFVR